MIKQLTILALSLCGVCRAQVAASPEVELSLIGTDQRQYSHVLAVFNENETLDYYTVNTQLGSAGLGLGIRSFGKQFFTTNRFALGYSMGLGYNYFASYTDLVYRGSSTNNADSIVNLFDNFSHKNHYHVVRFDHFVDIHWNPSGRVKITNSVGLGIKAIVKVYDNGVYWGGGAVSNEYPVLSLRYQPQITEKYERFSVSYFASFQLWAFNLFENQNGNVPVLPDFRVPYTALRWNSIGIRLVPHPRLKEALPNVE